MKEYTIQETPDKRRHFTEVSVWDYDDCLTVLCHSKRTDRDAPKPYHVGSIPRVALDDIREDDYYHCRAGFDYIVQSVDDGRYVNVICIN